MAFDPFSGASKPLPPELFGSYKDPLPFGAVPRFPHESRHDTRTYSGDKENRAHYGQPTGLMAAAELNDRPVSKQSRGEESGDGKIGSGFSHSAQQHSPYRHESLLPAFSSLDLHRRQAPSISSPVAGLHATMTPGGGHEEPQTGSDEWMRRKVAQCVDRVESRLDLNNLGLTELSSHVGELARFVELKSRTSCEPASSPAAGPVTSRPHTPRTVSSSLIKSSPLHATGQEDAAPARGTAVTPLANFRAREFGRTSSAPAAALSSPLASSSALLQLQTHERMPLEASSAGARNNNLPDRTALTASPSVDDPRTSYVRINSRGFAPPGSPVLPEDYPNSQSATQARSPFGVLGTQRRPMDRTSSLAPPTPANAVGGSSSSPKASEREGWKRTPSGTYVNAKKDNWSGDGSGDLEVSMANNQLTRLPTALFSISNLVQLSLRSNHLTHLPAAISQLKNLKELNIALNKIETLPPTMLDLDLRTFIHTLNPLRPKKEANWHPKSKRWLGGLETRRHDGSGYELGPAETAIAPLSLREMALSVLLSSREPHQLPPLLTETDWSPETSDEPHALEDASAFRRKIPALSKSEARRMIASVRSATNDNASSRLVADGAPAPSAFSSSARKFGRASTSRATTDDAEINPYFSPCPNPAHHAPAQSTVTRRVYLHDPVERRIEWVRLAGTTDELPILWKGCSSGCLAFLEEEEATPEEPAEDGFDADLLAGESAF